MSPRPLPCGCYVLGEARSYSACREGHSEANPPGRTAEKSSAPKRAAPAALAKAASAALPLSITIEWDPNLLCPNRVSRLHWGERTRRKNAAKKAAGCAYLAAREPRLLVPVDVEILVRRGQAMDDDNVMAALKPVRDVLFGEDRVTPNDAPRWVRYTGVTQQIGPEWKGREEVVFVVQERRECS